VIKLSDDVTVNQLNHRGYVLHRQVKGQRLKYMNQMRAEQKKCEYMSAVLVIGMQGGVRG
jgi:hypothetical protein